MDYISGSLNYYSKLDLQLLKPKMSQSQKTLEFLQKLKDIGHWNEDYDYSRVDYVNNYEKVLILVKLISTEHLISPSKLITRNTKPSFINSIDKRDFLIKTLKQENGFCRIC